VPFQKSLEPTFFIRNGCIHVTSCFTRSKFGRRRQYGTVGRQVKRGDIRNGPIGFIDSFFFPRQLHGPPRRSAGAPYFSDDHRAWTARKTRRFDDGGFHDRPDDDLANPACTRPRFSQIFVLIRSDRIDGHFRFRVFFPLARFVFSSFMSSHV